PLALDARHVSPRRKPLQHGAGPGHTRQIQERVLSLPDALSGGAHGRPEERFVPSLEKSLRPHGKTTPTHAPQAGIPASSPGPLTFRECVLKGSPEWRL